MSSFISAARRNFGWLVLAAATAGYYTAIFASTHTLATLAILGGAITALFIILSLAKGMAGEYESAMGWFCASLPGIFAFLGAALAITM